MSSSPMYIVECRKCHSDVLMSDVDIWSVCSRCQDKAQADKANAKVFVGRKIKAPNADYIESVRTDFEAARNEAIVSNPWMQGLPRP